VGMVALLPCHGPSPQRVADRMDLCVWMMCGVSLPVPSAAVHRCRRHGTAHAGSGEGYWACVRMAMAQIRSRSASASCAMADGAGQSSVVRAGYAVARLQGVPCPAGYPFFSLLYRKLNVLTQLAPLNLSEFVDS